jgi:hypothetical protein
VIRLIGRGCCIGQHSSSGHKWSACEFMQVIAPSLMLLHGCAAQVTCSVGGSCSLEDSGTRSGGVPRLAPGESTSTSTQPTGNGTSSTQLTRTATANKPPVIELVTSPALGPVVTLKRGSSYAACSPGTAPLKDAPCEPGAWAMDPDGGEGGTALNLTDQVVACPPAECLTQQGCSSSTLRAYRFSVNGLKSCTINLSEFVGAQFVVDFWVWDAGVPQVRAGVNRSLVVGPPCPDASSPYWCTNSATGSSYCSGVPCTTSTKLLPPSAGQVHLVLQPAAAQTLYLPYGEAAPWSLRPCQSLQDRSGCGAVAWQPLTGATSASSASGAAQDLTGFIQVTDVTPCNPSQVMVVGAAESADVLSVPL